MGESGRDFGLEVMRKSKFKKPKKPKLLNMMGPNFLYNNSYHFFNVFIIIIIIIIIIINNIISTLIFFMSTIIVFGLFL